LCLHQFCQTEVENLRVSVARHHDVVGFQIAMHDARCMRLSQAFRYLLQIAQQFSLLSLFAVDLLAQRRAIDELHRDEVHAIAFADLIDVCNVRVIERRGRCRLLLEAAHSISMGSKIGREYFQRDFTVQPRVLGEVDFPHPTRANLGADFVAAKFCACG
jgi:hypothetical protein